MIEKKPQAIEYNICPKCDSEVQSNLRTCKLCKCKLIKRNVSDDDFIKDIALINPYKHFKQNPIRNYIKVIVGEPKMLHPNSFENLVTILRSFGLRANAERYSNE